MDEIAKREFKLVPDSQKRYDHSMILETDQICLWNNALLFYNMALNRLRATPILLDSVSRNYFDFDLRRFEFDSFHKIECFRNGMFTILLRNRQRSSSTIVTFNVNNMQDPENRVFDYYTI